ncbi:MAG: hypothetical protein ACE5NP_08955 [Anaerolineae bacterium]
MMATGGTMMLIFTFFALLILVAPLLILIGLGLLLYQGFSRRRVGGEAVFQPADGSVAPGSACLSCGRLLQTGWTHCPYCGKEVVLAG